MTTMIDEIVFKPIGIIRSPFSDVEGMPIQPMGAKGVKGSIELDPDMEPGIKDLDGFSHIILIYHFHLSKGYSLHVIPFLDKTPKGVFATRVPRRPNGIGLSVVKLTGIHGTTLEIEEVDVLDKTPLLDLKPFVPQFDNREVQKGGWFATRAQNATEVRADKRFVKPASGETEPTGNAASFACLEGPSGRQTRSSFVEPLTPDSNGNGEAHREFPLLRTRQGKGRGAGD